MDIWQTFLTKEKLPDTYLDTINQWFRPLAKTLTENKKDKNKPLVVGINGCQGSGKSTLAKALSLLLTKEHQLNSCIFSIDDFYLTRQERIELSETVHPLLISRGVPGTHDTNLLKTTLKKLLSKEIPVEFPRFDKAIDDRYPENDWQKITHSVDIIIIEGWFTGAASQNFLDLIEPINTLEKNEDKDGVWRHFVNCELEKEYQEIFSLIDELIMLKAPNFDCVLAWRTEQEEKLKNKHKSVRVNSRTMNPQEIERFIQHFQRITEHCLATLPATVNHCYSMNSQRKITKYHAL